MKLKVHMGFFFQFDVTGGEPEKVGAHLKLPRLNKIQ